MDLWVYTEDFERIGVVDTASSIIWTNRFRQCGDFEIYTAASPEMVQLLRIDRWVKRPDDDMVGVIEKVQITTSEEEGDHLIVSGRCARSILDRRIIWEQTILSGTVEACLRKLVTDACISPTVYPSARRMSVLALADAHGFTETVATQYTGTVLLEAVEELCAAYNYGFKMRLQDGSLVLDFYKGADRSASQSENPRVVFSEDFDNLIASNYTCDKTNYKTVVLAAGEGEGKFRSWATAFNGAAGTYSGLQRRELYVDARDMSSNDGEVSTADYLAQLQERGLAKLLEAAIVESFDGSVADQQYLYGVDYFLGDTVTVINKHGLQSDAQVLEVVEVWDENGYGCTPTFG